MGVEEVLREELAKQTVFANRDFLSPSYIPSHMPFREGQLEKVTRTLAPALKGKKPNNIFLYGKTGTGKSSVARSVADKILEYSKREHSVVFRAYMNCKSSHNTKYQILANIAQELNPDERLQGFAVSYLYNKIKASVSQSGAQLIVILDEVDRI
ncbi:MAG TPA: AAA family ATPase, partial [archaeon]|nr:AAA family ATPase [archaeon]